MKILLAGGGSEKDSVLLDKILVDIIPKEKKLLYLPIAMDSTYTYEQCFEWITATLTKLDFKKIDMWTDLAKKQWNELETFGAIYIGGGNTFKLLNDIKNAGFDKLLLKFLMNNGIIYGGSAGAIILGKDIMTASFADENKVGLKNTSGLNILNNHSIWCHYKDEDDKKIFDYINKYNIPVIAIPERSGIFLNDKIVTVIGFKQVHIFDKKIKKSFNPNTHFSLYEK